MNFVSQANFEKVFNSVPSLLRLTLVPAASLLSAGLLPGLRQWLFINDSAFV